MHKKRIYNNGCTSGIAVLMGILLLLIGGTIEAQIKLPEPKGSYCVGRIKMEWVDKSRSEDMTVDTTDFRMVIADIWYPSKCGTGSTRAYLNEQVASIVATNILQDSLQTKTLSEVEVNHTWDGDWINLKERKKVLFFSPGHGIPIGLYTSILEQLSSLGYVVCALSPTYDQPTIKPNGVLIPLNQNFLDETFTKDFQKNFQEFLEEVTEEVNEVNYKRVSEEFKIPSPFTLHMKRRADDVLHALEKLKELNDDPKSPLYKQLYLELVGAFGHSFGGATMGQLITKKNEIGAVVNMDGWQFGEVVHHNLSAPLLWLRGDHGNTIDLNDLIYWKKPEMLKLTLKDSKHFNFSDIPIFSKGSNLETVGSLGYRDSHNAITKVLQHFFDAELFGDGTKGDFHFEAIPFIKLEN